MATIKNEESLACRKAEVRKVAHAARNSQADKDGLSKAIINALVHLAAYQNAGCVMWYVDVRTEVRTRHALPEAIASGKKIVMPFCVNTDLNLFHLESMSELTLGKYGILEPREELRQAPAKQVAINQLDMILVPGVGFDRDGGRIGHGNGYYDRLLKNARSNSPLIAKTLLIGLAFECQLFDEIPVQPHDIFMDAVITEKKIYLGKGRSELSLNPLR